MCADALPAQINSAHKLGKPALHTRSCAHLQRMHCIVRNRTWRYARSTNVPNADADAAIASSHVVLDIHSLQASLIPPSNPGFWRPGRCSDSRQQQCLGLLHRLMQAPPPHQRCPALWIVAAQPPPEIDCCPSPYRQGARYASCSLTGHTPLLPSLTPPSCSPDPYMGRSSKPRWQQ